MIDDNEMLKRKGKRNTDFKREIIDSRPSWRVPQFDEYYKELQESVGIYQSTPRKPSLRGQYLHLKYKIQMMYLMWNDSIVS